MRSSFTIWTRTAVQKRNNMSENISSSVLFHFTSCMDNLKSILTNGFFPHYCPEYTLDPFDREAASTGYPPMGATPLVSFCDLPLSLIKKHLKRYGNFGIGLRKRWGIKNGVTPVIYTHAKAQTRPLALRLISQAKRSASKTTAKDFMLLTAYTKPFRGAAWRNGNIKRRVKFYDEREWRYVPNIRDHHKLFLRNYANPTETEALYVHFRNKYALRVQPDDIQYLIVPDDAHVLLLADFISRKSHYSKTNVTLVTTAIMTVDCIHQDI